MFNHILVPLDGSELAECVLPHILSFAQIFCPRVTFLNVLDPESGNGPRNVINPLDWAIHKAITETYLKSISDRMHEAGLQISTAITEGRSADGIINYAHEHNVDLIALSSHGLSGLSGWNISSIVQKVIYRANTSLLIIPACQPAQMDLTDIHYQKIFVGLDGSRLAEWVLPEASELAASYHALLLLAHVIPKPEIPSYMPLIQEETELLNKIIEFNYRYAEIYLKDLSSRLSSDVYTIKTFQVISGNPIEALGELVEQEHVDLVILNAHGQSGCCDRLYGSVTMSFIMYGTTPLLIMQDLYPGIIKPTWAEKASFAIPKRVLLA